MDGEVRTSLRVPIQAAAEALRTRHKLEAELVNVRLEGDSIVFEFRHTAPSDAPSLATVPVTREIVRETRIEQAPPSAEVAPQRQRKQARRNRMKTKGWAVVAKIQTARGHTAMIYQPLVDALTRNLSPTQQRAVVGRLLREQGNEPSEASIEYYLQSTLEYIQTNRQSR